MCFPVEAMYGVFTWGFYVRLIKYEMFSLIWHQTKLKFCLYSFSCVHTVFSSFFACNISYISSLVLFIFSCDIWLCQRTVHPAVIICSPSCCSKPPFFLHVIIIGHVLKNLLNPLSWWVELCEQIRPVWTNRTDSLIKKKQLTGREDYHWIITYIL